MNGGWNSTPLTGEDEALRVLTELRGKRRLCRGQSKPYGSLVPSIDRGKWKGLSRSDKLTLERQSIDLFRDTARYFAHQGEQGALSDDIIALMVLRHYGVHTRLLDWSTSPHVAAYFAVCSNENEDGEIWSFDHAEYALKGRKQWETWPETTRDRDGKSFEAGLTAFTVKEPPDWFVCGFYSAGFPRQNAQQGCYSLTARFCCDHAEAIANLLVDPDLFHLYIVPAKLKIGVAKLLRENHGVWRGSLFPDAAGAADTAKHAVFPE